MSSVEHPGWHVYVRYRSGGFKKLVPVSAIKEKTADGKKRPFNPQHLTDYAPGKFYLVSTLHGSQDGKPRRWFAQISGRLAESKEALQETISSKSGRREYIFPPLEKDSDGSEPSSTAEEATPCEVSNDSILDTRAKNKRKKEFKKGARGSIYVNLLKKKALTNFEEHSSNNDSINQLHSTIPSLQNELKAAKDRELQLIKATEVSPSISGTSVKDEILNIRKMIEDHHKATQSCIDHLEQKLEEYLSKQGNVPQHVLEWIKAI